MRNGKLVNVWGRHDKYHQGIGLLVKTLYKKRYPFRVQHWEILINNQTSLFDSAQWRITAYHLPKKGTTSEKGRPD